MSDPQRSHPGSAPGASAEADREFRIEQLLLSGLDHYFTGQYEQAINVWTRVVFLERGHSRARAYIERARSALAERHRESEEMVHRGVAAYNAGDVQQARNLLTQAVEQGGPHDLALVFLERLSRLESASLSPGSGGSIPTDSTAAHAGRKTWNGGRRLWWIASGVLVSGSLLVLLISSPLGSWLMNLQEDTPTGVTRPPAEPLPVIRSSETTLLRARAQYASGHLADALRILDRIGITDPLRGDADKLRADIQRELLAVGEAFVPAESGSPQ